MTKPEIVSLSFKLAGIYCLVGSISYLPPVISNAGSPGMGLYAVSSITGFATLLLLAVYLIFSSRLPARIASSMIQEEKKVSFALQDIQVLAFSIIGVWLLSAAIPGLVRYVMLIVVRHSPAQPSARIGDQGYLPELVADVLKVALGIYLFLSGKGVARLWQRVHSKRGVERSG